MTTTPTASPELPDLDRLEALARAAKDAGWSSWLQALDEIAGADDAKFIAAISPTVVLALIALARRAKPEGEAPQAVPDVYAQYFAGNEPTPGYTATQHAESGAQVVGSLPPLPKPESYNDDGYIVVSYSDEQMRDYARAALAAQSQGAQAAGDPDWHSAINAIADELEAKSNLNEISQFTALCEEFDRRGAALAAKAEAPAPRTELSKRIREAATADVTLAQAKLLIGAAEEIERAQQAAAPGALDLLNADELAALRRFDETCQDGEGYDVPKAMMQRLAAIGVVRRTSGSYYETTDFGMRVLDQPAPNASGTPEAPQTAAARDVLAERRRQVEVEGWMPAHDDMYDEAELSRAAAAYTLQGEHDFGPPPQWPWKREWWKPQGERRNLVKAGALILAEIERLDRAAQLDGGQGEGGSHG